MRIRQDGLLPRLADSLVQLHMVILEWGQRWLIDAKLFGSFLAFLDPLLWACWYSRISYQLEIGFLKGFILVTIFVCSAGVAMKAENNSFWMFICLVSDAKSNWQELMTWATGNLKRQGLKTYIFKIALWASVYYLWFQRNAIIHYGSIWSEEQILRMWEVILKLKLNFRTPP